MVIFLLGLDYYRPRTKKLEHKIEEMTRAGRFVCLNSATAAMEPSLRLLGFGSGDEVITSAYTYTTSPTFFCHVGENLVLIDTVPD